MYDKAMRLKTQCTWFSCIWLQ